MRKLTKILIPALLVVVLVASCAVLFSSAAGTPDAQAGETVVYVANVAKGTGDGSSPENAIGHAAAYDTNASKAYVNHAFTRALMANDYALVKNGGVLVIVDELTIDYGDGKRTSFSEFQWLNSSSSDPVGTKNITITSYYGGVDYREAGAKLVLDSTKYGINWRIKAPTTWEYLNIESKFDYKRGYGTYNDGLTMISFYGKKTVIDEEVKVTSNDISGNAERYPLLCGYDRMGTGANGTVAINTDLTINGGTWSSVIAGCYGMRTSTGDQYGASTGTTNVTVNGGTITTLSGSTLLATKTATNSVSAEAWTFGHKGDINITVNGGAVTEIVAGNHNGVGDGKINVIVDKSVKNLAKVWAYDASLGANDAVAPTDATITYDRSNLSPKKVKYFTTENATGEEAFPTAVVYVSNDGKGDGSSPDSPIGNIDGYVPGDKSYLNSAFYKGMQALKNTGGTIVIVGDTSIDSAESRSLNKNDSPSELTLPSTAGPILITSVYGGVDYRTQGAEFILDQDACAATFLRFMQDVTFDNINIMHRYDMNDVNSWGTPMAMCASGNKMVIGANVKVSSWDCAKNVEGNWFPAIVGGHRYYNNHVLNGTNVTIKAGNWDSVYAGSFGMTAGGNNAGKVTGDAILNIEGGKIGTVYGTSSHTRATASITGKLTINITGGYVDAVYTTAKNGATNEIEVNVAATAERVGKLWGGTSNTNIPVNAKVTYDRSVTRDDEVRYWNNVTVTGAVEDQPEPIYYTLYVGNVERGRGDGSSPENCIGHAPDYYTLRAQALAIIAANGGTNTGLTKDQTAITGAVYKKNALYRALTYSGNKIVNQGGIIVVCEPLTINATDAMRKSLADFWFPTGAEQITITSKHNGVDYRQKGARLVLDAADLGLCVELGSPTVIDHLTIEHRYNSKNGKGVDNGALIAARGNKLWIGYDVYSFATDINPDEEKRVEIFPSICGGHRYSDANADTHVTVSSGQWAMVVGGAWGSSKGHTGNATIGINGGKIGTVCGTTKATSSNKAHILDGSAWIGLWGGEVDNVYVVAKPGIKWGDASVGIGGTKVNGKIRATHPDYEGDDVQAWAFYYLDEQLPEGKVVGFTTPSPETGSPIVYLAVVAVVALVGATATICIRRKRTED